VTWCSRQRENSIPRREPDRRELAPRLVRVRRGDVADVDPRAHQVEGRVQGGVLVLYARGHVHLMVQGIGFEDSS